MDGLISLNELNEELGLNLESDNSETLGGFLLEILGEIPEENGTSYPLIEFGNYLFQIEGVSERRIERVKLTIRPEGYETSNEEE